VKLLKKINLVALIFAAILLTGCSPKGEIALKVTGSVAKEIEWTEDQVKKMDTLEVEATNKEGESKKYTGVLIANLIENADINSGAVSVIFVGDDGSSGETTIEEVRACADCIVSFRNQGGFSIVMLGFPGKMQIKGVVEIQVK